MSYFILYYKFLMTQVCPSVGRLVACMVGRSVCHNFLKGQETLPCSYRITCYIALASKNLYLINIIKEIAAIPPSLSFHFVPNWKKIQINHLQLYFDKSVDKEFSINSTYLSVWTVSSSLSANRSSAIVWPVFSDRLAADTWSPS